MAIIKYTGTSAKEEFPLTGVYCQWQPGQKIVITDQTRINTLLASDGWAVVYDEVVVDSGQYLSDGTSYSAVGVSNAINANSLGMVSGGDSTANMTALRAALALAAGRVVTIFPGTYDLAFTEVVGINPFLNCKIIGENKETTILNFMPSSTTWRNLISVSNSGLTLSGLTLTATVPSTGQVALASVSAGNLTIEDCIIDGVVTHSGATLSHSFYGLVFADSGTQDGIYLRRNKIKRATYFWLKNNAAASAQNKIRIIDNEFRLNYYNDLGLNSPSGICDDVIIENNTFESNQSIAASEITQALGIALASVTNFRVSGNHLKDSYTNAIHIEENCKGGSVISNTIIVDGDGIFLNGNNIGGVGIISPSDITISNNEIIKYGTVGASGSMGIGLVFNGISAPPAKNIVISNNIIDGFESGIYSDAIVNDGCKITNNSSINCTFGYSLRDGSLFVRDNSSVNCTYGIMGVAASYAYESVTIESHGFKGCTYNVSARDQAFTLLNPYFEFDRFNHPGGSTSVYKTLFPIAANNRAHGFIESTHVDESSLTEVAYYRDEITWDGTTFTRINKVFYQPGSVIAHCSNNFGSLDIQVFSNTATINSRLKVKFNGMAVIAP